MHRIKKHILHRLILSPSSHYAKIKPKDVEGNLFMYHLKKLIKENFIRKKNDGKYELTPAGKLFADKLSLKSFQPRIQPNIVTLTACKNEKGEFLLYKRKRQPFLGLTGFPYGKIHLGEKITDAAKREFKEKTGLSAILTHKGDVYLTTLQKGELISYVFCHIFSGNMPKGQLKKNAEIGECFWAKVEDIKPKNHIPGFLEIYKILKQKPLHKFFKEFILEYPSLG